MALIMKIIDVADIEDTYRHEVRVTIEREDGKRFIVNIPEECWCDDKEITPHGLNLVFGDGIHYE